MSHANRVHWPWPAEERVVIWSGSGYMPSCRARVRSYNLRLTNHPDAVTCLRCKALIEEADRAAEERMAKEYMEKVRAPLTKEQRAAIDAFMALPRCTEEADLEGDRFQCTKRADGNHEHFAEALDGKTGSRIRLRWDTLSS